MIIDEAIGINEIVRQRIARQRLLLPLAATINERQSHGR
jgi:hypothetical protein